MHARAYAHPVRIVYYAHHHGSGHLRHARRFAGLGVGEVVVVGAPGADVELPPDTGDHPHREPDGSPFHFTPHTRAVRERFAAFHDVLRDADPDLVLVDVSVEAAVFAHLTGFPVAHRRMPGSRDDRAHRLLHATARGLFAYYPRVLESEDFPWADRTSWLGTVSDATPLPRSAIEPGTVVVLSGAGGAGVSAADLAAAAAATPRHRWHVLGPRPAPGVRLPAGVVHHGWVADPTPWLARAEVVVCGAGHNTVATVAGTRRPVILAPEPRPHDEQVVFAQRLHEAFGVPVARSWAADWGDLLASPGDGEALAAGLLTTPQTFRRRVRRFLEGLRPGAAG